MSKRLIFDFDQVVPFLPEGHRGVGHLEAMAWGPKTKEGHRTLLLVSNSKFKEEQETQFLLFEVKD